MAQENIDRIWALLSSISKEAIIASKKKCMEKEFDVNKSIVGLDESLNNLAHVRDILKESVENRKLIQFPFSFQLELEAKLGAVVKDLKELSEGTDTIDPLVKGIDQTYYLVWRSQLENISSEVLGYQEKLNKVKALELELENLKIELKAGLELKAELAILRDSIKVSEEASKKQLEAITENSKKTGEMSATILAAQQEAAAKLTLINTTATALETTLKNSKANDVTITSLATGIKEFYASIEANRKKIDEVCATANTTVTANNSKSVALIEKLTQDAAALGAQLSVSTDVAGKALESRAEKILLKTEEGNKKILVSLDARENEIKDQLAKVVGLGLFTAFQTRMDAIVLSKNRWIMGVFVTLALIAVLTIIIAFDFSAVDKAFYLKLSIYFPLLAAILFCINNYGHERQLEEEYAFKSSISLSLVPYKDLVEKSTTDKEKYADFLIKSVNNVFTSPTDKVFSHSKEDAISKLDKHIDKSISRLKDLSEAHRNTNPAANLPTKP